jgi:hypothetical protein
MSSCEAAGREDELGERGELRSQLINPRLHAGSVGGSKCCVCDFADRALTLGSGDTRPEVKQPALDLQGTMS